MVFSDVAASGFAFSAHCLSVAAVAALASLDAVAVVETVDAVLLSVAVFGFFLTSVLNADFRVVFTPLSGMDWGVVFFVSSCVGKNENTLYNVC